MIGDMATNISARVARRLYGGAPEAQAAFTIREAAHFLYVQEKVLRRWATGETGTQKPVIRIADRHQLLLSFLNLSELHVLSALRGHEVPLRKIRQAVQYLQRAVCPGHPHPLLAMDLETDGINIFVDELTPAGSKLNITKEGQLAMSELFAAHLHRIDRDADTKTALRLYPFAWKVKSNEDALHQPKPIVIDPRISFGRPVIVGTRVPTTEIAERVGAGEQMAEIAEDMRLELAQVEAAVRYHIKAA